jgi:hypothetical protein
MIGSFFQLSKNFPAGLDRFEENVFTLFHFGQISSNSLGEMFSSFVLFQADLWEVFGLLYFGILSLIRGFFGSMILPFFWGVEVII